MTRKFPNGKTYCVVEKRADAIVFDVLVSYTLQPTAIEHGHGYTGVPGRMRRFLHKLGFTRIALQCEMPQDFHTKIWRIEFQR